MTRAGSSPAFGTTSNIHAGASVPALSCPAANQLGPCGRGGGDPASHLGSGRSGAGGPPPAVGDTVWVRFAVIDAALPSRRCCARIVRVGGRDVAAELVEL